MSEAIKDKDGVARTPDTSYTEYLEQDSKKVPDFIMEENFEFLGSEDIAMDRYTSKEFFQKKLIVCGLEFGNSLVEWKIFQK